MERSGMLSPTISVPVPRYGTKLRNQLEYGHKTPQLNKHGVGSRGVSLFIIGQVYFSYKSIFDSHNLNQ
jgi:hypothetical protein